MIVLTYVLALGCLVLSVALLPVRPGLDLRLVLILRVVGRRIARVCLITNE